MDNISTIYLVTRLGLAHTLPPIFSVLIPYSPGFLNPALTQEQHLTPGAITSQRALFFANYLSF
jgi:hypothetical protein